MESKIVSQIRSLSFIEKLNWYDNDGYRWAYFPGMIIYDDKGRIKIHTNIPHILPEIKSYSATLLNLSTNEITVFPHHSTMIMSLDQKQNYILTINTVSVGSDGKATETNTWVIAFSS